MRQAAVLLAVMVAFAGLTPAHGQLVIEETFSYPDGSLAGRSGGTGWGSNAWEAPQQGAADVLDSQFVGTITSSFFQVERVSAGVPLLPSDGSSFWLSFDFSTADIDAFAGVELQLDSSPSGPAQNIGGGIEAGQFWAYQGDVEILSGTPVNDVEYRMVVQLIRHDATPDRYNAWIDPVNELSPLAGFTEGEWIATGAPNLSGRLVVFGGATMLLDDVRVGLSFADVVPSAVPEPGTYALLAIAAVAGLGGFWRRRVRAG